MRTIGDVGNRARCWPQTYYWIFSGKIACSSSILTAYAHGECPNGNRGSRVIFPSLFHHSGCDGLINNRQWPFFALCNFTAVLGDVTRALLYFSCYCVNVGNPFQPLLHKLWIVNCFFIILCCQAHELLNFLKTHWIISYRCFK